MKAVCDLLADFFGVKAITWQSSSSKAESWLCFTARCVSVVSAPSGYPRVKAPICPSFKHISETAPDPDWDLILFPLLLILSLVIFCQSGTRKMAVGFEENLIFFKLHNWIYYHFFLKVSVTPHFSLCMQLSFRNTFRPRWFNFLRCLPSSGSFIVLDI